MKQKRLTILLILTLTFIWGNSLLPGELSGVISDNLMSVMNVAAEKLGLGPDFFTFMADQDGDGVEEPTSHVVRKMAHVTEFAVLGALLWLRLSALQKRTLRAFLLGVAAGAVDETLQIFSHRGSQVRDVGIDALGVLLGLGLTLLITRLRRRNADSDADQSPPSSRMRRCR